MHEAVWTRERAQSVLESPDRLRSEDARKLWSRVGLVPGMTVVDLGAGSGFYTFPASARVGPIGRVYAVDVSSELVDLIRERALERHRSNIQPIVSRPGRVPLPEGIADRVLLANVLHGVPPATVAEAVRILRPGGRLVDVDWKKEPTPGGPPVEHRLAATEARQVLERYGLRTVAEWELGPYHYVLVLEKERGEKARGPRSPRGRSSTAAGRRRRET
jgi:ubiquinone/menaquinone biosynthesis C-methylase UbiE